MVAVLRRLDHGAVAEGFAGAGDGGIEGLREAHGRGHEDIIGGSGDAQLAELDLVRIEPGDLVARGRGDIAVAKVAAGRHHLLVAEICEVGGRGRLGGAIAVTVEDVGGEHRLAHDDVGEKGRDESAGQLHLEGGGDGR